MRLLFVPAFACDGDLYEPLIPLLRPDFDCETVTPAEPDMAACARLVLDAAGEGPFLVAGTSFGGHVAREVALMAPDRVRGLVVMGAGPAGVADRTPLERRRAAIEADGGAEMLEEMARRIVFEPEGRGQDAADAFRRMAARATAGRLLAQNEALATRPDRGADLGRIPCPALLLWGAEDAFSPPSVGEAMAGAMPDARFVPLDECGHLPSLEAPMRVAAEIRRRFVVSGEAR
ncbi:alpha/beta fold hydrolase [Aureimonas ureilytica]|uniref:alpha/beta fold hydrolase n=1 Tax=Aureimonas ureilytica TaxID=401562 RepID=UPI00037F3D53|nr:alpha/beta hydrolase [Aureimonas ureilytica]